jgi:Fe-S oxidoreductase
MEIQVMDYVAAAMRGDLEKVATLSFECVMCGACAAKCPAEISQPTMALLARRLYGRHVLSLPESLYQRIKDIENGRYDPPLKRLVRLSTEELKDVYTLREQEPQENMEWVPREPHFPENLFSEKDHLSRSP